MKGKKWLILPEGFEDSYYGGNQVEGRVKGVLTFRRAFVDLGVINIITAWIECEKQPIAFLGKPLL